jgi:YVTN family beta-propeller protein
MLLEPDGSIKAVVRIPSEPSGVATLPGAGPGRVYVTGRGSGTVTVIDVAEQGVADTWPLGSGRGERLSWVVEPLVSARAIIAGSVSTETTLRAVAAGPILLRAVFSPGGGRAPYTFDVRLNPALEASTAVLRKDQYDRVMNVLNAFHPLGVEVSTRSLRDRVVEIRDGLLDAFPGYTFPNFRSRGSIPRPPSQE